MMVPTDYLSGLENWLTNEDVEAYLDLIQVNQRTPTLTTLKAIIRQTYACIPFQNLTMLTRPRQPPCLAQIRDDMLNGLGGLCTTINPFLCALLQSLGFQAGLLKVSLAQPDCHIGVIVNNLQGRDYWLDVGNGFPYLEPLPLEDGAIHKVLSFSYQLLRLDDGWSLKQTVLGSSDSKINQQFKAIPCHYAEFTSMRQRHYTQHEYGPFLSGIRVNSWTAKRGLLLRDDTLWTLPGRPQKIDISQARNWLAEHFANATALLPLLDISWNEIIESRHH